MDAKEQCISTRKGQPCDHQSFPGPRPFAWHYERKRDGEMTKTLCDRCGKDVGDMGYTLVVTPTNTEQYEREGCNTHADLCHQCVRELGEWIWPSKRDGKVKIKGEEIEPAANALGFEISCEEILADDAMMKRREDKPKQHTMGDIYAGLCPECAAQPLWLGRIMYLCQRCLNR